MLVDLVYSDRVAEGSTKDSVSAVFIARCSAQNASEVRAILDAQLSRP